MRLSHIIGAVLSLTLATVTVTAEDFIAGTGVHFTFGRGQVGDTLKMIRQAGFVSIRDEIPWSQVESQKGQYRINPAYEQMVDEAIKNGTPPILILCYGNNHYANRDFPSVSQEASEAFIRYCEYMVGKFKGKVRYFEFWNEWDYGTGMKGRSGSPEDYARLLKLAYPRLKAVNPDAVIIAGAVSDGGYGWTERALKAGAAGNFDAYSVHPYTHKEGAVKNRGAEHFAEVIARYVTLLRKYHDGKDKPIYITEMGFPTDSGPKGRSEDDAAGSLVKTYVMAKTFPTVKGMWWYDFMNDGWNSRDEENCFGLVYADLTPKRPYFAMLDAARIVKAEYRGRVDAGDRNIWIQKFHCPGRSPADLWVVWSSHEKDLRRLILINRSEQPSPLRLRPAGYEAVTREWGSLDWTGNRKYEKNRIDLCLSSYPWIIEGDLSKVVIGGTIRQKHTPGGNSVAVVIPRQIYLAAARPATPETVDFSAAWEPSSPGMTRNGTGDSGADFSLGWDKKNLYLTVTVTDDRLAPQPVERGWEGDSLQFGIYLTDNGTVDLGSWSETTAVLTPQGMRLLRLNLTDRAKSGMVNGFDAGSSRDGNRTVYRLKLDAGAFERQEFRRGDIIGLSLAVNDNDGRGRKGWLRWGDGIVKGKDAAAYNWVLLK